MTSLVGYLLLFVAVGVIFVFFHLVLGLLVRPIRPSAEKLTIYECGEPTIGSSWIQFDLRFYVVALLFVIFDVEVAFFFPWAVVFGEANNLAQASVPADRKEIDAYMTKLAQFRGPGEDKTPIGAPQSILVLEERAVELVKRAQSAPTTMQGMGPGQQAQALRRQINDRLPTEVPKYAETALTLGWLAFLDIVVFFAVLLVGFAYLWKRGDINWVRSTAAEAAAEPVAPAAEAPRELAAATH